MMKTFTYAAAIALLTASAAFAQTGTNNSPMMNNSTPTPAARGTAEGTTQSDMKGNNPANSSGGMNQSGSMSSGSMNQSSDMDHANGGKPSRHASTHAKSKAHHVASNTRSHVSDRSADARENQETMQLNRQQVAGAPGDASGMSTSNGADNPFDRGSPQQAQGGGPNCTPDRPDCGTARQNPAINSSPQQRTYNASPQ